MFGVLQEVPMAYTNLVDLVVIISAFSNVFAHLWHLGERLIVYFQSYIEQRIVYVTNSHSNATLNKNVTILAFITF